MKPGQTLILTLNQTNLIAFKAAIQDRRIYETIVIVDTAKGGALTVIAATKGITQIYAKTESLMAKVVEAFQTVAFTQNYTPLILTADEVELSRIVLEDAVKLAKRKLDGMKARGVERDSTFDVFSALNVINGTPALIEAFDEAMLEQHPPEPPTTPAAVMRRLDKDFVTLFRGPNYRPFIPTDKLQKAA